MHIQSVCKYVRRQCRVGVRGVTAVPVLPSNIASLCLELWPLTLLSSPLSVARYVKATLCLILICHHSWIRHTLIVGLLATERLLLPVRRSGTVYHTTLLTVCHWRHSARNWKLSCFLYHFHDYIFLFSGPWSFYLGHFKNFLRMYVCMYHAVWQQNVSNE